MARKYNGKGNGYDHRFAVRSGVPMPTRSIYPFHRMDVGQSFKIPKDVSQASVRAAAHQYARRSNPEAKFRILRVYGDEFGCWRVK